MAEMIMYPLEGIEGTDIIDGDDWIDKLAQGGKEIIPYSPEEAMMELYDLVRIKETGETGQIVEIYRKDDGTISQYLVEKDEQFMDGENDLVCLYPNEIEILMVQEADEELVPYPPEEKGECVFSGDLIPEPDEEGT